MGNFSEAFLRDPVMESPYIYWLCATNAIGIVTYERAGELFGSVRSLALAGRGQWEKTGIFTPGQMTMMERALKREAFMRGYEEMNGKGIRMLFMEDGDYPERLKHIPDPPLAVFLKGKLPPADKPVVSVIGTRECSDYGKEVAGELGEMIALSEMSLVSGMARGIDSLSQYAAVKAGGYSLAVLGGGVDVIYPRESGSLYRRLLETGGIISEYVPGTYPVPKFFARRNRIISGISDAVCVIEAREKSGTMITVDCALEQGREVYAVPGRITDRSSRGCHELIKQGATIVTSADMFVESVMETYGMTHVAGRKKKKSIALEPGEAAVLSRMDDNSFTADEIRGDESFGELMSLLISLTGKGLCTNVGGGRFLITGEGIYYREEIRENKNCLRSQKL